ncbi:hypothetical protein QWY93_18255 [Echinicola jeungdonensis]|nr:putative PEP-binding protein [Echinicola jeungdonensis]MDN3671249.1 hypothetical protein [Echinicola jeungdonensis]
MFILADPDQALPLSRYPNQGVGLMRMEFIVANQIKVHPMALMKFKGLAATEVGKEIAALTRHYPDKKEYFVRNLAEALSFVAAAFYPKDVIIRMSDFKTNEYAKLLGEVVLSPKKKTPCLGLGGHPDIIMIVTKRLLDWSVQPSKGLGRKWA